MGKVTKGKVTILKDTTRSPLYLIGKMAGECYGSDTKDTTKNIRRGRDCLESMHGRTLEFPDVYMKLEGYSARVIREWYTHIGGAPTRLQSSTRYIDYENFGFILPPSINNDSDAYEKYFKFMDNVVSTYKYLAAKGVPREDVANVLPLGMATTISCKHNLRNLIDMSHQRMCTRAYWEYRELFDDVAEALLKYSNQWEYIVDNYFMPKCKYLNGCPEKKSCGWYNEKGKI
jgi:thymidylate synthase (FAD)